MSRRRGLRRRCGRGRARGADRSAGAGRAHGLRALTPLLLLALAIFPACDGAGDAAEGPNTGAPADAMAAVGPWVRVAIVPEAGPDAPPVNTAAYFILQNPTDSADALVGVETPIADTAEVHSVSMDDGAMRMRAVDSVPIPAHGEAVLEPGGYHVMLIGIAEPLAEGDTVPLRIRLRSGRVLDVAAPVLRSPPM